MLSSACTMPRPSVPPSVPQGEECPTGGAQEVSGDRATTAGPSRPRRYLIPYGVTLSSKTGDGFPKQPLLRA